MRFLSLTLSFAFALVAVAASGQGIKFFRTGLGIDTSATGTYNLCVADDQLLTTTGTIEEVLATCTIPGGSLGGDFSGFEIIGTYIGAANANSKTGNIRVDGIGGTIVLAVTGDTDSADTYELMGTMMVGNTSAGNISGSGTFTQGTGPNSTFRMRVTGLTLASDIDIVFTGLTATSAGDITLTSYRVTMISAFGSAPADFWPLQAPTSCAAVQYTFAGDLDTGMCQNAADDVRLFAGGAARATFTENLGNITSSEGAGYFAQVATRSDALKTFTNMTAFTPGVAEFAFVQVTAESDVSENNAVHIVGGPTANQSRIEVEGGLATQEIAFWDGDGGTLFFHMDIENTEISSLWPFRAADGTEALPSYSFTSQTDIGMRAVGEDLYFSVDGADNLRLQGTSAQFVSGGVLLMTIGTAGGTLRASGTVPGAWGTQGIGTIVGTEAAPGKYFTTDTDSGLWGGTNVVNVTAGGVAGSTTAFNTTDTTFETELLGPNGLVGAPTFSFAADPDMGMWKTGGTLVLQAQDWITTPGGGFAFLTSSSGTYGAKTVGGTTTGMIANTGAGMLFQIGGTDYFDIGTARTIHNSVIMMGGSGTEAAPFGLATEIDPDTGIWKGGGDIFNITSGGAAGSTTNFNATNTTFEFPILGFEGSLSLPGYGFAVQPDAGLWITGAAGSVLIQNKDATPDLLGRARLTIGEEAWSLSAVHDTVDTRSAFSQGSSEASPTEMRLRQGVTADTANETEIYMDPDQIAMRVEDTGVNEAQFLLDENSTAVLTLTSGANVSTTTFSETGTAFSDPITMSTTSRVILGSDVFANLGAETNGSMVYCSDCTKATPCAGSGTGAFAKRINAAWDCD